MKKLAEEISSAGHEAAAFPVPDYAYKTVLGVFDAVRAANILNLSYFDRPTLTSMLAHLRDYLTPGGLLAVCRTLDDATNHATIFRRAADGRLEPLARHGDGSEVEALAVAVPPAP